MTDTETEAKLLSPPNDAISQVVFAPTDGNNGARQLLVSSWDCTVRLYDLEANSQKLSYRHNGPVLDCTFENGGKVYSGGLDKTVRGFDLTTANESTLGNHDAPIRCVHWARAHNALVTGGWDTQVRVWDPKVPNSLVGTHSQPDKVYTMDTAEEKLVVGTAGRKVQIWDLRNMSQPSQRRDSSLKYQTRCIRCFPNGQGYAQSSIEGRVAVEYMDPSPEAQKKKYAFKCHRVSPKSWENA